MPALYLIKEDWENRSEDQILNESSDNFTDYIRIYRLDNYKRALEEMPTNAAGSGAVAGMGVNGPDDVKVSKKKKFKYKKANKIDAENYHSGIKDYVNRRFNGIM